MLSRTEFDPPAKLFDVALTFNPRPLEDHLHNVARDMLRFSRQIATLTEDVKLIKGSLAGFQNEVSEVTERLSKSVNAHESQIRVQAQAASQTVTVSQFNASVSQLREQVKTVEVQLAKIEGPSGKRSLEVFEQTVESFVTRWSKNTLAKDLETREVRAQEYARLQAVREMSALNDKTTASIAGLQKQVTSCASLDQFRVLGEQIRERQAHERERLDERMQAHDSAAEHLKTRLDAQLAAMNASIAHMGAQLGPLVSYDAAKPSPVALSAASGTPNANAATTTQPADANPEPSPEVGAAAQAVVPAETPPQSPVDVAVAPVSSKGGLRAVDVDAVLHGIEGAQTRHILEAPAFRLFRQQLQEDMRLRMGLTRQASTHEAEEQMFDVRQELRTRTTPDRVLELIKQHADVRTPQLLSQLEQRVNTIDRDKASHHDLREGLRAKGDLHVVDQKADKIMVQERLAAMDGRVEELHSVFAQHQSEREEFRDVLRDVVYAHRRGAALNDQPGGSRQGHGSLQSSPQGAPPVRSAAVPHGGPVMRDSGGDGLTLPAIGSPRQPALHAVPSPPADAGVDPRPATDPRAGSRTGGGGSRGPASNSRTGRQSKSASVVGMPPPESGAAVAAPRAGLAGGAGTPQRPPGGRAGGGKLAKVEKTSSASASASAYSAPPSDAPVETPAQAAYREAVGGSLGRSTSANLSADLKEPGQRETLAVKSSLETESASRKAAPPPTRPQ